MCVCDVTSFPHKYTLLEQFSVLSALFCVDKCFQLSGRLCLATCGRNKYTGQKVQQCFLLHLHSSRLSLFNICTCLIVVIKVGNGNAQATRLCLTCIHLNLIPLFNPCRPGQVLHSCLGREAGAR